ncbi:MAG: class I SAM-dependent methyltransferase [Actinomycetota bacterium]
MLTVDYDRLGVRPGELLLDLGCGSGRHTFEALRRGLSVAAVDLDARVVREVVGSSAGACDEQPPARRRFGLRGDALALPFEDHSFDRAIVSEVLEHITEDQRAMEEVVRVLKPGGTVAVSVPRWWPERVCWALSAPYHQNEGGHLRIYRAGDLTRKLRRAGLSVVDTHHAHALHSPYWWLKCAFGVRNEDAFVPRLYHRFLVWDLMTRPPAVRRIERALDPLLGKSIVVYLRKQRSSPARP